jgi:hypothetical protein
MNVVEQILLETNPFFVTYRQPFTPLRTYISH